MFTRYLFFICLVLYVFAGCSQEESPVWELGMPFPKENIIIGIIYPNNVDRNSVYDYSHHLGILEMQRVSGIRDDQIIIKTNVFDRDPVAVEGAIRDSIANGANIIIAASFGYMDVCVRMAEEFPSVVFAHATGTQFNDSNLINYSLRNYQARYLSGIVAGLRTESNKIGYVAAWGRENSEVSAGLNAFAMGVESVNPNAEVYVAITYSWFDLMGETNAANQLISMGCDVIAQHTNTPMPQIAAERAGVWGIGFNSDMSIDAPDAVISSVILQWGAVYTWLVESIADGTFSPGPKYLGLAEGAVDISPPRENLAAIGTNEALEAARQRFREGFNVFDGVIETNDGGRVGEAGSTLPDHVILGGINWYYRNIIEL